jgi:Secretion system C-terminal sorting domain
MSKYFQTIFMLLFFMLLTFSSTFAQSELVVDPGFGTLQDVIAADTNATGDRLDPNRVYVLKRDGLYLLNGSIENRFHLRIKAEDGNGARPILRPGVQTGGGSSRAFRVRDDLTISGCYITNLDELGGLNDRILRVSADDARVVIDDCHLDYASQSALRLDNEWNTVIIKNSIISNIGTMDSPNNGRGIDDRGNPIDTLIYENNNFYNITSRILRDGGGIIKYARINHNTIVDVAQGGCSIGETIKAEFTNNLVINNGFYGFDSEAPLSVLEIYPLLDSALVANGAVQSVKVSNNNFYIDPALVAAQPDSINAVTLYDSTTAALVATFSTGTNNIEETVVFTARPILPIAVVTDRWNESVLVENRTEMDDGSPAVFGSMPFDFTYSTSAASYTAGSSGQPLGALTWFDMVVGVDDSYDVGMLEDYQLFNNYPNPFNPTTKLSFNLPKDENVKLDIFNVLGQKVISLINGKLSAGQHTVDFNANNLPSGLYIYQLKAGSFTNSKKMMLLK